ncbi:hypothetical protein HNE_1672 [Hyphomonas neptunium ATCC 15444]|uniref:Lipoprotein n=2 Tax=Hyphomonas TaxID=85 RepID=Q0C1L3_HYPNA|nr:MULTISPECIES: hypothetical protein [Hyphomonas]ABI76465.1 hypothetical protein HNE_1672 [Hyphomonas neptunium ATCC 15444]KCZ92536.1 hypothetical protein HHI_11171 [Hyphomonas hirschiana VP5]
MPVIRPLVLSVIVFGAVAATASANGASDVKACKAMAATLPPKQTDITRMTETRDAAAETVETAGTAWEDAETHRLVSSGHAATADQAKAAYDAAKQVLARRELALQASVSDYNDDIAVFNSRCAKK